MVNDVSRDTVNRETHSFCDLAECFSLDLMPVSKRGEVGAFAVNVALNQREACAYGIEWHLVLLAEMRWHINELNVTLVIRRQ